MNKTVIEICKKVVSYVEENKHIPSKITVNGVSYNYGSYAEILASAIVNKDTIPTKKVYDNAPSPKGEKINRKYSKDEYIRMARMTVAFYQQQKRCPNYLHFNGKKILPRDWIYSFARIVKFINEKQRYPTNVLINSNYFKTTTSSSKVTPNETYNYFIKVFGSITSFDDAMKKIQGRGYGYYYNDKYTNKQVIDNLKHKRNSPNCTDSCQMMWWIAKALGLDVKLIHVKCKSGGGHVYLKVKKPSSNTWLVRDPACCISDNGKPITAAWCTNGTLVDVNPDWFMETVRK